MRSEQDDKLNKLLAAQVSIAERTKIATELDDYRLQIAATRSREAQIELERRRHLQLLEAARPAVAANERELEQKFGILYSHGQIQRDFDQWCSEAIGLPSYSVGVIFLDIDNFKQLNSKFTESIVDRTLFPDFQRLVAGLCLHRGAAYRYGGEELLILLPNCPIGEAAAFSRKVCRQIAANAFRVEEQAVELTTSIGVAAWPLHGDTLQKVIERANREERTAKDQGKNRVSVAIVDVVS
jgi:diguanylate cyclase (GGDEF)-like protein